MLCACVCERERKRKREIDKESERERERNYRLLSIDTPDFEKTNSPPFSPVDCCVHCQWGVGRGEGGRRKEGRGGGRGEEMAVIDFTKRTQSFSQTHACPGYLVTQPQSWEQAKKKKAGLQSWALAVLGAVLPYCRTV